jgi:sulfopyruvate decarboxylase TPP-binding subunit
MKEPDLQNRILEAFQHCNIEYLITVPTSKMDQVYKHYEEKRKCIYVTREEEGASLAAGLAIGNIKSILFIQQTGVGNLLNSVFSFADSYGIYFPILVMDRGEKDDNPVHHISSKKTSTILSGLEAIPIDWRKSNSLIRFKDSIMAKRRWMYSNY